MLGPAAQRDLELEKGHRNGDRVKILMLLMMKMNDDVADVC